MFIIASIFLSQQVISELKGKNVNDVITTGEFPTVSFMCVWDHDSFWFTILFGWNVVRSESLELNGFRQYFNTDMDSLQGSELVYDVGYCD